MEAHENRLIRPSLRGLEDISQVKVILRRVEIPHIDFQLVALVLSWPLAIIMARVARK